MEINEIRSVAQGGDVIYIDINNNNINDFFDFFEFAKEKGYTEISIVKYDHSERESFFCKRNFSKEEFKQVKIEMYIKDIEIANEQIKLLQNED